RLHEEARPVVGLAYGAGQLIVHRREPGLLRRAKPSLETGATGSDVARQMPGREPALGEGNQAAGTEAAGQVSDGGALVADAVDSVGRPEQIAQPPRRIGEPRRLEVGASGEQPAHHVEVDVMRAVGVVTGHVRILLAPAAGFTEVAGYGHGLRAER